MVRRRLAPLLLASGCCMLSARAFAADPTASTTPSASPQPEGLQSPEQRDTRHSAYSLPQGMWTFNVGALGVGSSDVFATLGAGYGLGAGFQVELNLAHASVGLLNIAAQWHFVDTQYFDLGAGLGFWYGHGAWFWIAEGLTRELVSKLDVFSIPMALSASMPVYRWLELDLSLEYSYAEMFGTTSGSRSIFHDAQIGARQLALRPGVRWFMWHSTSLELSAQLPAYSSLPVKDDDSGETEYHQVPFSDVWSIEAALRSRFTRSVFGNLRLHYGEVARLLYGAALYPSFELEVRL